MQTLARRLASSWGLGLAGASVAAFVMTVWTGRIAPAVGAVSVLAGDPFLYARRIGAIAAGGIPYLDVEIEHLPLALAPMALSWAATSLTGLSPAVTFALVSATLLGVTGWAVARAGALLDDDAATGRWLLLVVPLLPLILFRNDTLATAAAALALWWILADRAGLAATAVVGGILAKGWPVVFAVDAWWRGRRARAVATVAVAVGLGMLLLATPGFRSGRSFSGIHVETVVGSGLLAWRHLTGLPLGLAAYSGATYLEAGPWAVLVELLIGTAFGIAALTALRAPRDPRRLPAMLGAVTLALLLGSPLLSAQFLLWPTPFLALSADRRLLRGWIPTAVLTLALLGFWRPDAGWWAGLLVARNLLLLAVAALAVGTAVAQEARTSRRNLPV